MKLGLQGAPQGQVCSLNVKLTYLYDDYVSKAYWYLLEQAAPIHLKVQRRQCLLCVDGTLAFLCTLSLAIIRP